MFGGPRPPRSCLARFIPERSDKEETKKCGWRDHGLLVIDANDPRLAWPERELIKQLGEKLYGRRQGKEVKHGR
ncbi:MAG: hypothetical protein HQK87_10375 [Nitrospinae bacterium]|nr:hypothetical protein [Magnetococcales bacterium]MBF0171471.1 hypothetical protein [Nitrospinota bacterium]